MHLAQLKKPFVSVGLVEPLHHVKICGITSAFGIRFLSRRLRQNGQPFARFSCLRSGTSADVYYLFAETLVPPRKIYEGHWDLCTLIEAAKVSREYWRQEANFETYCLNHLLDTFEEKQKLRNQQKWWDSRYGEEQYHCAPCCAFDTSFVVNSSLKNVSSSSSYLEDEDEDECTAHVVPGLMRYRT